MDIDDLAGALRTVSTVLAPDGWFHASLLHPCFPGDPDTQALPSWPESGYATEGWWTTAETGVRGHVGAHHRTLATYVNQIIASGLTLTRLTEPAADLPRVLLVDARKPVG